MNSKLICTYWDIFGNFYFHDHNEELKKVIVRVFLLIGRVNMDSENIYCSSEGPGVTKHELPKLLLSDVTITTTDSDTQPSIVIESGPAVTEKTTENDSPVGNGKADLEKSTKDRKIDYLSPNVSSEDGPGKDPRMVRSTSLKTNTSTTSSPSEKKIVRFADALGLDLADVRHFSKECLPKVSRSAFAYLNFPNNSSPRSHSRKSKSHRSKGRTLVPQFDQPGSNPLFYSKVLTQKVCLENVQVNGTTVRGMVVVSNLGFEKIVHVRYTTDYWTSKTDITAEFVPSNSTDKSFDRFNFRIGCHSILISEKLIFVIKYTVNGQDYWDNNNENDYILECRNSN